MLNVFLLNATDHTAVAKGKRFEDRLKCTSIKADPSIYRVRDDKKGESAGLFET